MSLKVVKINSVVIRSKNNMKKWKLSMMFIEGNVEEVI